VADGIAARRRDVKRLLVTVLSMEAVVVLLAIVPAKQLEHVNAGLAGGVCGAIAVVALALCGYVGRGRGALYAGSVFQVLVIASGVLLTAMYILGAVFAALWFTGIWLGRKWERDAPAAAAQGPR
jgi:ABC-type enterobactin transport system permease subunit